jgi:hypothetical protein
MQLKKTTVSALLAMGLSWAMAASATVIDFAVMPEAKSRQDIWPVITQALMTAKQGDTVTLTDPRNGTRVASVLISEEVAEANTSTARSNWLNKKFGGQIGQMKRFLTDVASPAGGNGDFTRYVRSLELRKTEFPGQPIQGAFFGSPLQTEPAAMSMVNRYPADSFLLRPDSVFSVVGHERALQGVTLHVVHSAALSEFSDRNRDFHQAKVKRFFGMFVGQQSGNLASFSGSPEHLRRIIDGNFPKIEYGKPEMRDGKPTIFEVLSPTIERQDKNLQTSLWEGVVPKNQSAPSRMAAPMDIGITWNRSIDLDIYVQPEGDAELFFGRIESAVFGGRFLKDIQSLPGSNGFETVTYTGDVPLKRLRVYVNHYGGVTDAPVEVEMRIRVLGSIYAKKFRLPPGQGTRGAGDRNIDPAWVRANVAEIMGL